MRWFFIVLLWSWIQQDVSCYIEFSSSLLTLQRNHIYQNQTLRIRPSLEPTCSKYERDDAGMYFDTFADVYLWHPQIRTRATRDFLYGTAYAQRFIWDHQHPKDCGDAKFLTMLHWPMGIGASLHFLARALGLAIQLGRILVFIKNDLSWYDERFCPDKISWECWFEPITSCRLPRAILHLKALARDKAMRARRGQNTLEIDSSDRLIVVQPEELSRFRIGNLTRHYLPAALQELLVKCSFVKPNLHFYWWQSQAVTYFIRFNKATRMQLDMLRQRLLRVRRVGSVRPSRLQVLPRGSIAAHVRHGDKGVEMALVPFAHYINEADRLAAGSRSMQILRSDLRFSSRGAKAYNFPQDAFAGRVLFVNTENPRVLDEALNLAHRRNSWNVAYTHQNRTNAWDVVSVRALGESGKAALESFLNLELALEADAWVCTLISHWCQLIDELRMTIAGKAAAPYINLASKYQGVANCPPYNRQCYMHW